MKVLLVNGGPHEKGCTYTALNEIEKVLNEEGIETEIFWIGTKAISGCIACHTCSKIHKCVFNDCVNKFLLKAKEADGFIFGSPVHYAAATGAVTSFMDRVFYADGRGGLETFRLKPAAAVVSARRAGTTAALDQLNKYFSITEMPIVSSQYWNMVHGNSPEEVAQDKEGLQIMRTLGRNMAWMLKCLKAAKEMGVELPTKESPERTNFIH